MADFQSLATASLDVTLKFVSCQMNDSLKMMRAFTVAPYYLEREG